MRRMKLMGEENMSQNKQYKVSSRMPAKETSAEAALWFTFMEVSVCCEHGMMWWCGGNKSTWSALNWLKNESC